MFHSVQYRNGCLAASDLFHMFTQSIKLYTSHYHVLKSTDAGKERLSRIKEYRCLKSMIHQIDSKNERLLLSASFTTKFGLVFVLTLENAFS